MARSLEWLEKVAGGEDKRKIIRSVMKLVSDHKNCRIDRFAHCDIRYDIIDLIHEHVEAAVLEERTLMPCGHPRACLNLNPGTEARECSACGQEKRVVGEMKGLDRGIRRGSQK